MKQLYYLWISVLMIMPSAMGLEVTLKHNGEVQQLPLMESVPEGVSVSLEDGAIRIQNSMDMQRQVALVSISYDETLLGKEAILWYQAAIRSEAGTAPACLEMLCVSPEGGEFFSRALNEAVEGATKWRTSRTPFFLTKNDKASAFKLGVLFQGKGTVYLKELDFSAEDNIASSYTQTVMYPLGAIIGIGGGVLGGLIGIWGALAGFLVSRGKGKRFVLTTAVCFDISGLLLLAAGGYYWANGMPRALWYGLGLSGFIITCVVGGLTFVLWHRYAQHDAARLERMNQAESL